MADSYSEDQEANPSRALLGDNADDKKHEDGNDYYAVDNCGEDLSDRLSRLSNSSSFSKFHPTNSAPLTAFLLLNTMIGSGILNQPYVFRRSGLIGGVIGFIIATWATWTGLLCLTEVGIYANVLEYSSLAKRAFPKFGELLVDISIIVQTCGCQLGYILVIGTLLSSLLQSWGCNFMLCNIYFTTICTVALFVAPVCMFRHFGHLAILSLFSIATIVSVLLLVLIAGPIKHTSEHISDSYELFNVTGALASTGSVVLALSCAQANFQAFISTEKKAQNMPSWTKVTGGAVLVGAAMCAAMGVAGYLSFGKDTDGEILEDFPEHGYDFFKIMVVAHLILYIPVNFVIMRYSLVKVFMQTRSELLPFVTHTIITVTLLALVTAVVLMLLYLGLASGVAFALIQNITGGIGGKFVGRLLLFIHG